ncbi:TPA: hypothetical protein ACGO8F_001841 [Streptococcus suis]
MKYRLTIISCIAIVLSLLVFSQLKSSVDLPAAETVVIYQGEEVVKEVTDSEAQLFLMGLETTKPYFFKNGSNQDTPTVESFYTMLVGEETFYLYEENGGLYLMKPYDYTVELATDLDTVLE